MSQETKTTNASAATTAQNQKPTLNRCEVHFWTNAFPGIHFCPYCPQPESFEESQKIVTLKVEKLLKPWLVVLDKFLRIWADIPGEGMRIVDEHTIHQAARL